MENSKHRERVLKAFNRQQPDRIPIDFGSKGSSLVIGAYDKLKEKLGLEKPTEILDTRLGLAQIDSEILDKFKVDTRYVYMKGAASHDPQWNTAEDTFVDEWGVTLKKPKGGLYYDYVKFPIQEPNIQALKTHQWPDPDDPTRFEGLREEAKALYDRGYAVGTYIKGVWETTWALRSMENACLDLLTEKKFYLAMADRVADVLSRMVENFFCEVGDYVQWICVTCDLGSQENLLISPQAYKEFVRPFEIRIYEAARKHSSAKIAQHSCGAVYPLIPNIIDAGVEILNPIQTSAKGMDTAKLKAEFGNHLCFWGGIDVQQLMSFGTVQDIAQEVERVMGDLGPGGGYLFGPSHDIQTMTPPENVLAMYETALQRAQY